MMSSQSELLNQRYGQQKKPNIMMNSTIELLLKHKSTRHFLDQPLGHDEIHTLVAAAQSASTSSNLHQWSIVVVTDPELKSQIFDLSSGQEKSYNQYIKQAPAILLWIADLSRNHQIVKEKNQDVIVHDYLDSFVMATIDATLAAQNAVIAAESLGLGICYIGAVRNRAKELATLINLPQHSYITFGLVVGHPDLEQAAVVRPRPTQDVVLHYNVYDQEKGLAHLKDYEPAFQDFRKKGNLLEKTWEDSVISSTQFSYLDGRENLRETVESYGFKLK